MNTFGTLERQLKVATANMEPAALAAQLAAFAKSELAAAIQRGDASPPYETVVNGRVGAAEESVIPPGPIVYVFSGGNLWPAVIGFALDYLQRRSPVDSGDYRNSFVVIADGRIKGGSYAGVYRRALLGGKVQGPTDIPASAKVIITNTQPYTRKIEMGAMRMSVPPGLFKDAESAVAGEYGEVVSVSTQFLRLHSGIAPDLPYILKGAGRVGRAVRSRQSSAYRAGRSTLTLRRDSRAGQPLTYPSLVLNMLVTD
jgi:hypothetical protein